MSYCFYSKFSAYICTYKTVCVPPWVLVRLLKWTPVSHTLSLISVILVTRRKLETRMWATATCIECWRGMYISQATEMVFHDSICLFSSTNQTEWLKHSMSSRRFNLKFMQTYNSARFCVPFLLPLVDSYLNPMHIFIKHRFYFVLVQHRIKSNWFIKIDTGYISCLPKV